MSRSSLADVDDAIDRFARASASDLIDVVNAAGALTTDVAIAAALAQKLRLLSVGVDGPTVVEELPYRLIREARQAAATADSGMGIRDWVALSGVGPWLVSDDEWTERLRQRRHRKDVDLAERLAGRVVQAAHVDYGYPETGAIHATLVLDTGESLLIDSRDRVSGYDHDFRLWMARSVHESTQSPGQPLATLVGRRIDAVVDISFGSETDLVLESLPRIYYLTTYDECYLVWRSSPIEEVGP